MGTSHIISQSFAHAFEMKFQDREGNMAYPHLTSWGATTRLIGAVIMTHGDAKGLVMPPRVAPIQVVIIPIFGKNDDRQAVMDAVERIKTDLSSLRVHVDADEQKTPGAKFYHWELKGVPLRIEIGARDLAQQQAMVADRIGLGKKAVALNELATYVPALLETIQQTMFERARERRDSMWHKCAKLAEFAPDLVEHNGFYQTGWCRNPECEALLKQYQATTRCLLNEHTFETCFNCDQKSQGDVLIAKAY
jgi:prolyl-tRNA synthetase